MQTTPLIIRQTIEEERVIKNKHSGASGETHTWMEFIDLSRRQPFVRHRRRKLTPGKERTVVERKKGKERKLSAPLHVGLQPIPFQMRHRGNFVVFSSFSCFASQCGGYLIKAEQWWGGSSPSERRGQNWGINEKEETYTQTHTHTRRGS